MYHTVFLSRVVVLYLDGGASFLKYSYPIQSNSIQFSTHSFLFAFCFRIRFYPIFFFKMKAVLLGAVLTLLSSASSAVVYSDGAGAFSVNRGRHIPRSTSRHVRDTEHLSDFRIRSAPEEIGNIDLAGTIDPGLALSV